MSDMAQEEQPQPQLPPPPFFFFRIMPQIIHATTAARQMVITIVANISATPYTFITLRLTFNVLLSLYGRTSK